MKLSLIIVLVLKLVNCAICYSENANLKNVGKNLFDFNGSDISTTSELHKTKYEDKLHYFCSACLNKALCKVKGKCYMCNKHCKNFKNPQENAKFKISTVANFHPDQKIKFNTNNTPSTELTLDSKIKNDTITKLMYYIVKSALSQMSAVPKQTSIRTNFKQENLQTRNNSIQAEVTAIDNNLIQINSKHNDNDADISNLPYSKKTKINSETANEYQQNPKTDFKRYKIHLRQKRHLQENDINNTQIPEGNSNSARPYGGLFRKINLPDSNKNTPLLPNNKEEENSDAFLKPKQNQSINPTQAIANAGDSIEPVNRSVQQIPLITNRNQIPQFDVNQNDRIFKPDENRVNSVPFTGNDDADTILTSPLMFNNDVMKPCNENLDGNPSDGKTFSLLQNLEKKIENIADLIKQGCKYNDLLKSENPENSNGLQLNKNKMKLPGLPNDIFGKPRNKLNIKDRANLFPNRITQIPDSQSNNEESDETRSPSPASGNGDKILRDINPELFSEDDDQNSDQFVTDNLNNNDDKLENDDKLSDPIQKNKLETASIPFRNQFRLRKHPLKNDHNKPLITELFKKKVDSKPNLNNRFANIDKNDGQIADETLYEPKEKYFEEKPEETFEPGVPWSNNNNNNNNERSNSNLLPKSKPSFPKMKGIMQRNHIKDRVKNNALPLHPRENVKPAFQHINNFISKLNDAQFQKTPKVNPPWNRIANPDIQKLHFPLNKLDAEKPGRIPFQRMNSKPQDSIDDEQPKTRPFLLPKDKPGKFPNLPMIHQRFGEQDDLDPSEPVGSSINNYEQNPNTLLGHVVLPQQNGNDRVQSLDDMENKKIFFEGTGVNLPLTIQKNPEGTYKVSLAVDNICNTCNEKSCNMKEDVVGAPLNQENTKPPLKYKNLNDNVQNLSVPKSELGTGYTPQDDANNKFANVRESNNANEKIPAIKPRLFDKEHNFFNRIRNNEGVDSKPKPLLFPRLSQIAKRSPSFLFDSPILKLGENYLDSGYSNDFKTLNEYNRGSDFKNIVSGLNTFEGKTREKATVNKRVALMKDMLTWMKNVAEENT